MSIESDDFIKARLSDAVKMAGVKNIPVFLGFLNEREFSVCKTILDSNRVNYCFFGGYENAVRKFIAVLPDWADNADFPFCCLKFNYKEEYLLSHRDFLGTLMSLGIERDKVGDILVNQGEAFVFVSNSVASFCTENITKVGGVGVKIIKTDTIPDIPEQFEEITKIIASERADCVVGAICNLSREKAKSFILSGSFIINHIVCENITHKVKKNDILSIRGSGKYIVDSIENKTKKGRLILQIKKYL